MLTWFKENGPVIGALAGALLALAAILQLLVAGPINRGFDDLRSEMSSRFEAADQRFDDLRSDMNQRFNDLRSDMNQRFNDLRLEMNQRLDSVDQRLGRLQIDVSALHTLNDRVSRNEGQIDLLRERLQTVDAPEP